MARFLRRPRLPRHGVPGQLGALAGTVIHHLGQHLAHRFSRLLAQHATAGRRVQGVMVRALENVVDDARLNEDSPVGHRRIHRDHLQGGHGRLLANGHLADGNPGPAVGRLER